LQTPQSSTPKVGRRRSSMLASRLSATHGMMAAAAAAALEAAAETPTAVEEDADGYHRLGEAAGGHQVSWEEGDLLTRRPPRDAQDDSLRLGSSLTTLPRSWLADHRHERSMDSFVLNPSGFGTRHPMKRASPRRWVRSLDLRLLPLSPYPCVALAAPLPARRPETPIARSRFLSVTAVR
jgi:hypothetical protein